MKQLWPDELEGFLKRHREGEYTLVDVRGEEAFQAEHMPGSICIPALEIHERGGELDPTRQTVFLCERGAKSLAVALIYEEKFSPEGEVFNLVGGLDAWMGRLAYGLPKIRVIRQNGDLPRMLVGAMDLEKGAWRFYQRLERMMKEEGPVALVRRLVAMEISHISLLHSHLKRIDPQAPDSVTLVNSLRGALAEGGESVSSLIDRMEQGELGWQSLFEVALEIEMAAYDMYVNLADSMEGEAADIFYSLAEAEKDHIRMLLTEIDSEAGAIL